MTHSATTETPARTSRAGAPAMHTDAPPVVTGRQLGTRGRAEVVVSCPRCGRLHRHRGIGLRTAPCRATYTIRVRPGGAR